MNQRVRAHYMVLAQATGLTFDETGGALYGQREGFSIVVSAPSESYPYMLAVTVSAARPGGPLTKEERKQFCRENKAVTGLTQNGAVIRASIRNTGNQEKLAGYLGETLRALTGFLRAGGFHGCCQSCGRTEDVAPSNIGGDYLHLCPTCFEAIQQNRTMAESIRAQRPENVVGGIVGALLGSLVGVVCIVLLSQLGFVAAVSGIIMAVGTLKGYELLGGKLSGKGIVICAVLVLAMTYVGDLVDWGIVVSRSLEADLFLSIRAVPALLEAGAIDAGAYWMNLILLYVFVLLGAIPTILAALKNQRNTGRSYHLGVR